MVSWLPCLLRMLALLPHLHTHPTSNLCCFLFPGGSSLIPPSQASWADSFCSSPKRAGENELPMASARVRFSLLWWPWACWERQASDRAWSSVLLSSTWDPRQGHAAFLVSWHLRASVNSKVTLSVCRPQWKYYDLSSWAQGNLIINKVISFAGVFSNPQAREVFGYSMPGKLGCQINTLCENWGRRSPVSWYTNLPLRISFHSDYQLD